MIIRPAPFARRRFAWLMLLVAALFVRALAPEGWMPVAAAGGGIEIALCNGNGPADTMVLGIDGQLHHKAPAKGQPGDHPCAFAGIGIANGAPPAPTAILPMPARVAPPLPVTTAVIPGRGLAAPPPPATGPPALA